MKQLISMMVFTLGVFFSSVLFAAPERVNINTATAQILEERLDGVGPTRARAIIDWRQKYGKFQSVEELAKVKGIADSVIEKNKTHIDL